MPGTTNLSSLISNRLRFNSGSSFSASVIWISKLSIALGITILVVSVAIYSGFQEQIHNKLFSLSGHVSLRQFTQGSLYDEVPLSKNEPFVSGLRKLPEVTHIQSFCYKPALLRTEEEVVGVLLKGIGTDFNLNAFRPNAKTSLKQIPGEGEIWLSEWMLKKLHLKSGSEVVLFFLQDPPRFRKLKVSLIYETGLEDVDNNMVFVNQNLLRDINQWQPDQVGGFEIFTQDFRQLDASLERIEAKLPYNIAVEPVTDTQVQLFEWLKIIGRNVTIIFVLVSLVAGFNIASTLLIMVTERRQMVGVLKAMGSGNAFIRSIFIRNGLNIILLGMFWGNVSGFAFSFFQWKFRLIPLDPASYYVSFVPIGWDWMSILLINLGVLAITSLTILIPVRIVNTVSPAEAVRSV